MDEEIQYALIASVSAMLQLTWLRWGEGGIYDVDWYELEGDELKFKYRTVTNVKNGCLPRGVRWGDVVSFLQSFLDKHC